MKKIKSNIIEWVEFIIIIINFLSIGIFFMGGLCELPYDHKPITMGAAYIVIISFGAIYILAIIEEKWKK